MEPSCLLGLRRQHAFTLVELLVVILILGILLAVAAPSFLGQTQKAQDSEAKQQLSVAYRAAKAASVREQGQGEYVSASFTHAQLAQAIRDSEPGFTTVLGDQGQNKDPSRIVVDNAGSQQTTSTRLLIHNQSKSGQYCTLDTSTGPPNIYCNETGTPAPSPSAAPVVSDADGGAVTVQEGQPLSGSQGAWSDATSYSYQWQRASTWSDLVDASSVARGSRTATYTPASADVGHQLRVCVTASGPGGQATSCSAAVPASGTVLPAAPVATASPAITGTAQVGQPLSASSGTWSNSPSGYSYSWLRCQDGSDPADDCAAIGSTDATDDNDYTPVSLDAGKHLRVVVTATNAGGTTSSTSAATAVTLPAAPAGGSASVSSPGTAHTGAVLTAATSGWSGNPTAYSYQWAACDASGANCADIAAATAATYIVSQSELGKRLRVVVTAQNAGGSGTATSGLTAAAVEGIVATQGDPGTIYVMAADGTGKTAVTASPVTAARPSWHPSRQRILFQYNPQGNWEIYTIKPDGTDLTRLTNNTFGDHMPSYNPAGTKIAWASYANGADADIWTMNADGSGQALTKTRSGEDYWPSYSPDGAKIAFTAALSSPTEIYVYTIAANDFVRVTTHPTGYFPWYSARPQFSADGSQIAYFTNAYDGGTTDTIERIPAAGGSPTVLVSPGGANPSWSWTRNQLVFARTTGIWRVNSDGSGLTQIVSGSGYDHPSW